MNDVNTRKTTSGVVHHVSLRNVSPKPRRTAVTGITCMKAASVR
jgi:hypothetical protein